MSKFTVFVKNDPNRQVLLLPTNPSKKHFGLVLNLANTDFSSTNLGSINIDLVDVDAINKREWTRLTSGYGCLGFVNIEKDIYLVTISSQSTAFQYPNGEQIYRVTDVQFINLIHNYYDVDFDKLWAYERDHYDSEEDEMKELKYNYDSMRLFLSQNFFYYSVEVDLTRFTQSRVNQSQVYQFDDTFLWNSEMIYPLRSFFHNLNPNKKKLFLDNGYLVPLIQGYCDHMQLSTGEDLVVGIISRMGWKRAGTRFNTRGIDDSGHVANSTETEIIFYNSNFLFSFLQIRGSVPAFWEQNGLQLMGHKIQISRSLEATLPAFNQHIQKLLQRYKNVHIVNLLSQKEGAENQLGNLYANLTAHFLSSQNVKGKINFTDFDFHAVCKGNHFENALLLVDQLESQLDQFGFCGVDLESGRLMHTQEGVFRTNCLDCLDRTNVIQGLFTQYHLKRILQELGLSQLYGQVIPILSQLTGKNGDAISRIYAGTGALKSSFTKSGKSSIAGLLNDASKSVNRMYTGAVTDKVKQELTDMLLGKLPGQVKLVYDGPSDFDSIPRSPIQQASELQQSNPSQPPKKITVHCGTYNVNGRHPNDHTLADWILPPKLGEDIPDLYIMTFQEIVELTPSQILNADLGRKNIWQNILIKDINTAFPEGNYVFLSSEQLVGITILIFARASILPYVNQLEKSIKKTGFSGIAGNKGAAAIRFVIGEVSFCFVACHFASGQSKVEERNFDYQTIHNELTFGFNRTINHHNVVVYMGDFNYRINLSNEQVRLMAHNPKYTEQLQNYDQLKISMQRGYAFRGFTESPIDFFPTYRYDIGTDNYDTSEKRRIPAWTDRILYRGTGVNCSYYTRAELTGSDHKPVMAGFEIDLTKCLDEVKQRMNRPAAHDKPVISFSERNSVPKPVPNIVSEKSQPPPRPPKPQLANLINFDSEKPTLDCKGLPPPSDSAQQWWSLNSENNHSDTKIKDLVAVEADNDPFNYQFPPHSWNPQISTNPFRQPGFHFPNFSIQPRAGSVKKISDSWTPRNQKLMD